jgi:hypothetical protein
MMSCASSAGSSDRLASETIYVYYRNKLSSNRKIFMVYGYSLTPRQARICRIAAGLFLAVAVIQAAALLFALATPNTSLRWNCDSAGCTAAARPDLMLTTEQLAAAGAVPGAAAGWIHRLDRPSMRLAQAALTLAAQLPLAALLFCAAAALWRLSGRSGDDLSRALPWLLRASICTLFYALVPPLAGIARTSLLLSAVGPDFVFLAEFDLKAILMNLLLASIAFTVTWAIASGNRAQRDMAEIV